jgi:hypothetical protein
MNVFACYYGQVSSARTFTWLALEDACHSQNVSRVSPSEPPVVKRAMQARALLQAIAEKKVSPWEN